MSLEKICILSNITSSETTETLVTVLDVHNLSCSLIPSSRKLLPDENENTLLQKIIAHGMRISREHCMVSAEHVNSPDEPKPQIPPQLYTALGTLNT